MANKALSKLGWRRFSGSHSWVAAILVFAALMAPALALILTTQSGIVIAADWTTPSSVHDKCGEETGHEASEAIDDDTGTYWHHDATCEHWIEFDMGETKTITKIRIYQVDQKYWGGGPPGGITTTVYVSDDPESWGDSVWSGDMADMIGSDWYESGSFSGTGRYIKLVTSSDSADQRMYEFQAYAEVPPPPVKPTKPNLYSPQHGSILLDNTPTFEWENAENAENHRLLVDNVSDFSSPNENRIIVGDNSYTIAGENALFYNTVYFWRVEAINANGENQSDNWWFAVLEDKWLSADSIENKSGEIEGQEATKAIDDNVRTGWRHGGYYPWISFDVGKRMKIIQITICQSETEVARFGIANGIKVYVTDDTSSWGDNIWGGVLNATGFQESETFEAVGRYIKLESLAEGYGQIIYEFRFYAENVSLLSLPELYLPENSSTTDNTPAFQWTCGENADNHRLLVDNDDDFSSPDENRLFGSTDNIYTIASENALLDDNYFWKIVATNETEENSSVVWTFKCAPPTIELIYAGTENENWVNWAHMPNDNMSIAVLVTDPSGVENVMLEWYDNGAWENHQMSKSGDNYSITMTGLENGRDYSFDIWAKDNVGNWGEYEWERLISGGTTRRYIRANYALTDFDYKQFYLWTAPQYEVPDYNKRILDHEQGVDGGTTDTGYGYYSSPPTPQSRSCTNFVGWFLNDNITTDTTIENFYLHVWWRMEEDPNNVTFFYRKTVTCKFAHIDPDYSYSSTIDEAKAKAKIGGKEFYLETGYCIPPSKSYDSNDIYQLFIGENGLLCTWRSERPYQSFVILNLPDNTTLQGMDSDSDGVSDYDELYVKFTNPLEADTDNDGIDDYNDAIPLKWLGVTNVFTPSTVVGEENFDVKVQVMADRGGTLANIDEVWLSVYENSKDYWDNDNIQNHYTFKWIRGENFSEVGPDNTPPFDHIDNENSTAGDDSKSHDNWVFNITLPENALSGTWSVWAKIVDNFDVQDNNEFSNKFIVNVPPSVENLYITDADNVAATDLAPQTQYKFWVEIQDNENLSDIENVELVIYLDNENLADNAINHYTFRWTRDGGFEEVGPGGYADETGIVIDDNIGQTINAWAGARMPSQHKAFHVVGRFWQFYNNVDTGELLKSTSTDGETWDSPTKITDVDFGAYFDVALDDEDNFHFAKQYPYSSGSLTYRKGTPLENGDISWIAGWQTVVSGSEIRSDPHIIVDANGYPWIGYGADDYDGHVVKSDNKDGTWETSSGFPYDLDNRGYLARGQMAIPVPLSNGQVYVVYGWWAEATILGENQLRGQLYDGSSWEEEENVSTSLPFGYPAMWSASGMDNDVHVAMFTVDPFDIKYMVRTWGSGWGNEENVDTAVSSTDYASPVILLDNQRKDIWVFWGDSSHVYYRIRVNGAWENKVDWIDESTDKFHLYRGYTIGSALKSYDNKILVYYVTKTNDSTPYQLKFASIDLSSYDHLVVENSVAGDDAKTQDNFIFAIEFGEDATVTADDNWDVWIRIYDSAGNEDNRFFLNQFDIVSGAQEYSRPITQGFSLTELAPRGAEFGRVIEQGFSIGATVAIVMEICKLLSQAFGIAGTVGVTSEWGKSLTQGFSLDGSVEANRELSKSVAQDFSISATVEAVVDRFTQEYERAVEQDFSVSAAVGIKVERFAQEYGRSIDQGFSISESMSAMKEVGQSVSQEFSVDGFVSVAAEYGRGIEQNFSLSESVEIAKELSKALSQTFSLTATVVATPELYEPQEYERQVSQGFSVGESIMAEKEIAIDLSDAFSLSATVTAPASFVRGLDEELSFTATVETQYEYSRSLSGDFSFDAAIDVAVQRLAREYERGIAQGFSFEGTIIAHEYGDIYVTSPWCDGRTNPTDVVVDPTFSAIYTVTDNNIPNPTQFIQIQVGTSLNDDDLWDNIATATVENGQRSPNVSYDGMPLTLNSTYWWRCRFGDSNGNLTEWTSPQTFGYQEAPFDWVAAAMFIFPIVLMVIAFAFDNVVFASFAGIVFIISGLFFVDVIWLAMIFVGVGIYLLITAFLSEED